MQPTPAQHLRPTQRPAPPAPAQATAESALRRLTPAELRLVAGGLTSRKAGKGQLEYL